MSDQVNSFSRYLPVDQQARAWGWRLIDAGRQSLIPESPYPNEGHPQSYLFDNDGRRTLDEFQIVFIASGSGHFESASTPSTVVEPGTALLLFPGEWHRYRPSKTSGWTEYWLGFGGREATRIMQSFFRPQEPIIAVSQPDALIQHFQQILHWLQQPVAAKEQILASHVPLALALLKSSSLTDEVTHNSDAELVIRAKAEMLTHLTDRTDLEALASALGISYSRFRFAFKKQTGYSPREYENMMKLNRARDLLLREQKSVSETADTLAYSSVYYFSRVFKKQFGQSPQQWLLQKNNPVKRESNGSVTTS
ncbi:AraC family transcriptional regulator [Opitutales bacterium]|nr:AraC family transcriptional regulator [Opitutales bacterium]MDB2682398.1 AraC family transcriptional regulator [Opitutales bacterium]